MIGDVEGDFSQVKNITVDQLGRLDQRLVFFFFFIDNISNDLRLGSDTVFWKDVLVKSDMFVRKRITRLEIYF